MFRMPYRPSGVSRIRYSGFASVLSVKMVMAAA